MIETRQAYLAVREFLKSHPVRQEISGERNLDFSNWLRQYCRPSKRGCIVNGVELGMMTVHDLDGVYLDYKRKIVQLLEVKTRNGKTTYAQEQTLAMLNAVFFPAGFKYLGAHVLRMDGTQPFNSTRIFWDNQEISKEECWRKVNMLDSITATAPAAQ